MSEPSQKAPVRLRGHHLLCLRTYRGEGYPPAFGANILDLLDRLGSEPVLVVDGPDDVCAACPELVDGDCAHDTGPDSAIAGLDRLAFELLGTAPGEELDHAEVQAQLPDVWARWAEAACHGCDYADACADRQ